MRKNVGLRHRAEDYAAADSAYPIRSPMRVCVVL